MPSPQENGNIELDEEHQNDLDATQALVDKNLNGPVRTMHDNVTGTITRQAYDDQQAANAGVERTLQEHTAGGIAGFFGVKEAGSQYTAGTVADTTTDGNQAAIQARIAALSSRGPVLSQAANAQAASIDTTQQGQVRSRQLGLANMLTDAANGQGPSAAQAQLQAGTDASIAQSMALANSARGGSRSVAMKNAMKPTPAKKNGSASR